MRLLFCCRGPFDARFGASKAIIELSAEMEKLGWTCRLASEAEVCPAFASYPGIRSTIEYSHALAAFLNRNAGDFDVVDFDQLGLPFARRPTASRTLLVARSALLCQHFEKIRIPRPAGLRPWAGLIAKGPFRFAEMKYNARCSDRTFSEADLVNVNNDYDRTELVSRGHDPKKVVVVPLGLTRERLAHFTAIAEPAPAAPRIAFVGTFDTRKGSTDFPEIVRRVRASLPACTFRLLGVRRTEEQVRQNFPSDTHSSLEIVPEFDTEALPSLLRGCSLGVFPSYVEGFGFGVLEMLAASLPVFAYDTPGPPMMLPPAYLVPRGAAGELATRAVALLKSPGELASARAWAQQRAQEFTWERAAKTTSAIYSERLALLRH